MKTLSRLGLILFFVLVGCSILFPQVDEFGFYYVTGSGQHGIYLSRKGIDGNWSRGNKLLINGQFNGNAVDPDAIKLNDGSYRIYYYKGYFVTPPPPAYTNHEIYTAISGDGINYYNEEKAFEYEGITDPSVVQLNDGTFLMVCVKGNLNIFAKSNDGIKFQSTGVSIQNGGIPELVKLDNGSIRLFYNGTGGIVSSISLDGGNTWIKENGARLSSIKFVADPSVIRIDKNKWYLLVKGFNNTGIQNPAGHNVQISESNDCYTFNFFNGVLLDSASVPEGIILSKTTNVNQSEILPDEIKLFQNYPNPFNSYTSIKFTISNTSFRFSSKGTEQVNTNIHISIKIYDTLGKDIKTLVNENKLPGTYTVSFDASELSTGVYFYRLQSNNFSETKKFVLIK